ncbi:hypothetical protein MNEG_0091 [Monoraphidium neglectum]|uniref:Uncharacterized protein n=1 Tax=Monoraphidium neglectum TaxID=145388 RepID=A0A0D2MZM1_9CHLO|nr:hypothetical protein MNEG_0091 [Monoraphidium neglectum]KIZ07875.1 hypothetical protein MNEG_0091 [Monoraphidium neglectum]|eukprot:XP_013906894.1 hypothetical protein MNEG_0091 [Monoraphidium neglectum]
MAEQLEEALRERALQVMTQHQAGIRTAEEALERALSELAKLRAREERRLAERLQRLRERHEQQRQQLAREYEQQVAELDKRSQASAEQAEAECARAISAAAEVLGQRLGASAAPSSAAGPSVERGQQHLAIGMVSAPRITLASSSGSGSSDGGDGPGDGEGGAPAWHRRQPSLQGCDHQALLRQQVLQNARGPPSGSIFAAGSNSSTPRRRLEAAFAAAVVERGQRVATTDAHGAGNSNGVKDKGRKEGASIGRSPSGWGAAGSYPRFRGNVRAPTSSRGDGGSGSSVRRTYTDLMATASGRWLADGGRAGHLLSGDSD